MSLITLILLKIYFKISSHSKITYKYNYFILAELIISLLINVNSITFNLTYFMRVGNLRFLFKKLMPKI
jgi:hypothetical protein